jgi:hypothetical protein
MVAAFQAADLGVSTAAGGRGMAAEEFHAVLEGAFAR